ncbi:hypothetical protein KM1_054960 [Entamoeba histolytica HM-3:IMSS]|uniref:Uncharacterized protein n=1 Tax=Entamoeba histolytica HM-3:IMSS TaxID=885315 RepID=M7W1G1_ENTHI|nr:hypothetical protein KM1_054960 [Entamoeba histolytica HM-3:IMSS]
MKLLLLFLSICYTLAYESNEERHQFYYYLLYYVGTLCVIVIVLCILIAFTWFRMRKSPYVGNLNNLIPSRHNSNYVIETSSGAYCCVSSESVNPKNEIKLKLPH